MIPIALHRVYRQNPYQRPCIHVGMTDNYEITLYTDNGGQYNYADLVLPDYGRVHYAYTHRHPIYIMDAVSLRTRRRPVLSSARR